MINVALPNQLPIRNINPKKLGVVCPNGQINFQTEEIAIEFTKNLIVKALKAGKERAIITKDASVLKIMDGTKDDVSCTARDLPAISGCIHHHGHPYCQYGYTTPPFSTNDVISFILLHNIFGYKQFFVYNVLGEECTMTMKKQSPLSKRNLTPEKRYEILMENPKTKSKFEFFENFNKAFIKKYNGEFYLKNIMSRCNNDEIALVEQYIETKDVQKLMEWFNNKVSALVQHDMLEACASKLGIKYETTFSCLKGHKG